mmetsp:Transcript_59008/g.140913  ORF Transcript_59008/g.140913 Transcript_59008/m.140913 type:complete len:251 (-) Transcript_59008:20-772(-)
MAEEATTASETTTVVQESEASGRWWPPAHVPYYYALVFGPHAAFYRASGLADTPAAPAMSIAAAFNYALVGFSRGALMMMINERLPFLAPFAMAALPVMDCTAIRLALRNKISKQFNRDARILAVGLGWTTADAIAKHIFPCLMGSPWPGLTWPEVLRALASAVYLVEHVLLTAILWLWGEVSGIELSLMAGVHALGIPQVLSVALPEAWRLLGLSPTSWQFIVLLLHGAAVCINVRYVQRLMTKQSKEQ